MSSAIKDKMPIGWYLREVDSLLTKFVNQAFESHGINRYHWQIMKNIDTHEKICKDLFYHQVHRFVNESEYESLFQELISRNWIVLKDEKYWFTPEGKNGFEEISNLQEVNREAITKGTTEEEYLNTIRFLEKLIVNLGGNA